MRSGNLKSYLHLHLIVFIWGFTAVLGELISIRDASLVWYRMGLAGIFLFLYLLMTKKQFLLPIKAIAQLVLVGLLISIHWIFFFRAIDVSNVSVTLAMFSTGAFSPQSSNLYFTTAKCCGTKSSSDSSSSPDSA